MLKKMKRAVACFLACAMSVSLVGVSFADEIDTVTDTEAGIVETLPEENIDDTLAEPDITDEPEVTETPVDEPEVTAEPEITEEPTTAPEVTDEPAAIVYEEITEDYLRGLDFNGANVRLALDTLGGIEGIYTENYTDEELEMLFIDAFEPDELTMKMVVDTIIMSGEIVPMSLASGTKIKVEPSNSEVSKTFSIMYGNEEYNESVAFDYVRDKGDLVIVPNEGYKLTGVILNKGYFYEDSESDAETNLLFKVNPLTGSLTLSSAELKDEENGYWHEEIGRTKAFYITVTTARADIGTFSVTDNYNEGLGLERATYTLSNTGSTSNTASGLQEAIETAIANKIIQYGNNVTITVEPSKIASVEYKQGDFIETILFDKDTKSFSILAGADNVSISFKYKSKAGKLDFVNKNSVVGIDSYDYEFYTEKGDLILSNTVSDIEELSKVIQQQYAGTRMNLKINFNDAGYTINTSKTKWNEESVTGSSTKLTNLVLSEEDNRLELYATAASPLLTVFKYDKPIEGKTNDADTIILAQITNYDLLDKETQDSLSRPTITYSAKENGNPNVAEYQNKTVDCERAGAYWGMYFTPKNGKNFNYEYNLTVKASILSNGTEYQYTGADIIVGNNQ